MPSSTLTSKGQITLPKAVRDALSLQVGDRVQFVLRDDGVVEILPRTRDLMSLAGMVRPERRGVTLAELDAGIARAVAEDLDEP